MLSLLFSPQIYTLITRSCCKLSLTYKLSKRGSRDRMLYVQLPVQSVPIITKAVSSNPAHGEVYSINCVIRFFSDLWQIGDFLRVLRSPPPIKFTATI